MEETRGMRGVVTAVVLAVVSALVQLVWAYLTEPRDENPSSGALVARTGALSAHEAQLVHCVTPASDLEETLDDVGGLSEIKEEVRHAVVLPLRRPRAFFGAARCMEPSRGVLLVGAPGTGKTMLARAMAAEAGVPFLVLTLAALENKYVGESSKLLAAAFSLARKLQPCLVFVDEIDGMMRERGADEQSSSYGFKTEFLQHMDRLQASRRVAVIVVGATNNTRVLDPALKRRLPRVFQLRTPNARERASILELVAEREPAHLRELPDALLVELARESRLCTGSDLSEAYRIAAAARLRRHLKDADFERSLHTGELVEPLLGPIAREEWLEALRTVRQCKQDGERAFVGRDEQQSALARALGLA